jgi:serine protease AprX
MSARSRRWSRLLVAPLLAVALSGSAVGALASPAAAADHPAALDPGVVTAGGPAQSVVVSGAPGANGLVLAALREAGGRDIQPLPIVNGWSATVPADRMHALAAAPGVSAVTLDREVQLTSTASDAAVSSSSYVWSSGAGSVLASGDVDGSGVSIAVLDTGVSDVQDLEGRVMHGPDLSGENNHLVDSFGHGTVMAGIAAGDGSSAGASPRTGVAPGAQVISVKVAGANGATDVSTMLAGLSWIGAFKDVYNIKVLNLSWGVPSTQNPLIDPLNYAVERLWTQGVTVLVAAGNSGPSLGTIMKPGDDPMVITVGAYDDKGDSLTANDTIPAWASRGPTAHGLVKPDVVAPGRTLVAARAPGSTIEAQNPNALVGSAYIKGSGSSQATAVASGVAALLLDAHPGWTPDQVKHAMMSTASAMPTSPFQQGAGRVRAAAAMAAYVGLAPTQISLAQGTGSLTAARGAMEPISVTCDGQTKVLNDESTSWCSPWSSGAWTSGAWTSGAWTSGAWTSGAWTSGAWTSGAWTSGAWTSGAWTSGAWTSGAWTSGAWTSGAWTSTQDPESADTPNSFMTAFYGNRPPYWLQIVGEVSEAAPISIPSWMR